MTNLESNSTVCLLCGGLCPSGTLDTGLCATCDYKDFVKLVGSMAANLGNPSRRLGWSARPNDWRSPTLWTAYVTVKRLKWYGKRTAYGERQVWVDTGTPFMLKGDFATRAEAHRHAKKFLKLAESAR